MGTKERRAREKAARRQQILMAARHLLLTEGLKATSINKIAQQAELGVGTLYFYFKSKEEIFIALQKAGLKLLASKVETASRSAEDPHEQISRMARAYLAFSVENKDYFDIINYFIASPDIIFSPQLKQQIGEYGNQILAHVIAAIKAGQQQGQFKAVNPRRAAIALWGALHGLIQFKKLQDTILRDVNHQALIEDTIQAYLAGLAR